jgi:hypothetical protein
LPREKDDVCVEIHSAVIPGRAKGASLESIRPVVVMDSGLAAFAAPRNDAEKLRSIRITTGAAERKRRRPGRSGAFERYNAGPPPPFPLRSGRQKNRWANE